jgi:signal transduction histidine kinase
MERLKICLVLTLLGAAVFPGITLGAAPGGNSPNANISAASTPQNANLVPFIDSAVAYVKSAGADKAIQEFNDSKSTQFIDGELYIFALDFNGIELAHPYRPDLVGKNQLGLKDVNGVPLNQNMVSIAKTGNGFVYYVFANPAHNKKQELKLTYVEKVDDTKWLGSGTYLSNISANFSQAARDNLTSFVESATKYAKDNGKDAAIKAFNDKNGAFFKNGLYVFAYDFDGNTLAAPTQPDLVGKNRIDVKDPNGAMLIRDMATLAKGGNGYLYYIYADPNKNMEQRLKLSYVSKVDDSWWLGAGLYAQ